MSAQSVAQARYATHSFFILTGLPQGGEFGYDTSIFTVNKFSGVKLIPPGLHLFVFSAAPIQGSSSVAPESISSGVGVRHGLLKFFAPEQQVVVHEWDNKLEHLVDTTIPCKRRRRQVDESNLNSSAAEAEAVVVSQDYLKGLDSELAPYSEDNQAAWTTLVSFVTPSTVARVIGFDERNEARVEAVTASVADEHELKSAGGKQTWGKARDEAERRTAVDVQDAEDEDEDEEDEMDDLLHFINVDGKRSWPSGAVGEELTRWSKDKSWRLSDTVNTLLAGDVKQLLAEFQLSFVLFTLLHNFSSLTTYKAIVSLICRSSALARPVSDRPGPSTTASEALLTDSALPLFASFLAVLTRQVAFLDQGFFSDQMPGLDIFLLGELDALLVSLTDAAPYWAQRDGPETEVWRTVVQRWDALTVCVIEKYGWELGMIKGTRKHGYAGEQMQRALDRTDEVDIEDLEEGEDAPVIVEL